MSIENKQPVAADGSISAGEQRSCDLVTIDVDGTLFTSESRLSAGIGPLIHKTEARGIGVTLASGRAKLKLVPLMRELGLTLPYIGSGGAYIADPSNNMAILDRRLGQAEAVRIVELARSAKAPILAQDPDRLFYEGSFEELERLIDVSKINITGVEGTQIEIFHVDDILQACTEPNKITICGEPDDLLKIEKRLLDLPIYQTYSAPTYLEITPSRASKGEALKVVARYLAVPLERILVIGDSRNDISMFEFAGIAVAMGNASEEVKAAADLVAPSNDEGGVAWVLRELVLKEQEMCRTKGDQNGRPIYEGFPYRV